MKAYACNDNVIVEMADQTTTLANGMAVQEQRGKKDVVRATVRISSTEGIEPNDSVWFPYYAALPFPFEGELLYAVSAKDLIMVGKDD